MKLVFVFVNCVPAIA